MGKSSGGVREINPATRQTRVANSAEFKPFADAVRSSKNEAEAFSKIRNIKGVSRETAQKFEDVFATGKEYVPIEEAFKKFYKSVKNKK